MSTKISRHHFLKTVLAGAVVLATRHLPVYAQSNIDQQILIIGAGIAGLAAAKTLQRAGYRSIKILEGRSRVGGRIWTSHDWADIPLDLGASWIHGIQGNPIWELAQSADIQTVETDLNDTVTYLADGTELSDAEEAALSERFEALFDKAQSSANSGDYSLQDALDEVLQDENLSEADQQALSHWLETTIGHEYAAELHELSATMWDEGAEINGEDVIFPNGYEQIITLLAQDLDIALDHRVETIDIEGEGVRVLTNQGEFYADRCIVTLPLGVLKHGDIRFTPPLPDKKQAAIAHLGMGLLNKVYLRFPVVFWEQEAGWLEYIAPKKGEWLEWVNLDHYLGVPVLLAFNAGDYGRQIEALSDEQIVTRAMETLRRIYGADLPEPTQWQVTRWASDPFSYGSYSYYGVGANPDSRAVLAEPISDVLFFAGEATDLDYPSTVHGAYLSGVRAAQTLIEQS